ncbi:MAG: NAD(P)H-binding protein [Tepidisphaeraceae bacterium]|jgi:NADH dehydrogenase
MSNDTHAVTGAFGYSGRHIARLLLAAGHRVMTLTNSLNRPNPFGDAIRAFPFHFDEPQRLVENLRGVDVLYNTYWVRFNHANFTHARAVQNTLTLFAAAKAARVRRIVHVSITNPSEDSPLEYFHGKAQLERALRESGISHAIVRPAVLFGDQDILINNIAYMLRHLPFFGVFGDGSCGIQPIHVEDFAGLIVEQGRLAENTLINAVGPEKFTFRGLVETIAKIIDVRRPIFSVPPGVGYLVAKLAGWMLGDVLLTREEITGLMAGLLAVDTPPTGRTHLTDWARTNAALLGIRYQSELARRRGPRA